MNPIQLIRDFRKWREEKYEKALEKYCIIESQLENPCQGEVFKQGFNKGMLYGIEHRKEILKKVKI